MSEESNVQQILRMSVIPDPGRRQQINMRYAETATMRELLKRQHIDAERLFAFRRAACTKLADMISLSCDQRASDHDHCILTRAD